MLLERLIGKRLTGLSICEPWQEPGMAVHERPPLFGAIALEFDDIALVCKSTLRYFRAGEGSFVLDDDGHRRSLGFHLTLCSQDELACIQSATGDDTGPWVAMPQRPRWTFLASHDSAQDAAYMPLRVALDCPVTSVQLCSGHTDHRKNHDILALTFGTCRQTLWLTYRDDLDGAIQVAPPHWTYALKQIVFDSAQDAFGWLAPRAPYGIANGYRNWPTLEQYLQWLACRSRIGGRDPSLQVSKAFDSPVTAHDDVERFEHGMRLKLAQHANLKRRFLAIRYPVRGVQLDGGQNIMLQSLLLEYKIAARRNACNSPGGDRLAART